MWRSHGFPKKSSTNGRISWCFCIQGTGTLLHYLSYLCIHGDYFCIHGDSQKNVGVFRFPQVLQPCFWCLSHGICHHQVFVWLTTWWLADATRASLLFLERAVAEQPVFLGRQAWWLWGATGDVQCWMCNAVCIYISERQFIIKRYKENMI